MARTECATRSEFLFTASPANARPVWNTPGPSVHPPRLPKEMRQPVCLFIYFAPGNKIISQPPDFTKKKVRTARKGLSMRLAGTFKFSAHLRPAERTRWRRKNGISSRFWDAVRATVKYCNLAFRHWLPHSTICDHLHGSQNGPVEPRRAQKGCALWFKYFDFFLNTKHRILCCFIVSNFLAQLLLFIQIIFYYKN